MTRWLSVPAVLLSLGLFAAPRAQPSGATSVEAFLRARFRMDESQGAAVQQGRPVAVVLPGAVDREIVVAGAVRIATPADRTVARLKDVERLESGPGFLQTKRLSEPPRLDDFASFSVTADDLKALRTCRPGRCGVKLGAGAFESLGMIDWRAPDAEPQVQALARRSALEYVEAYRRGGNRELAIYRDTERPQFIAQEFADMVARTSLLPEWLPELAALLLNYPSGDRPPGFEELFYWSVSDFGLKPVFRLNHMVIIRPTTGATVYAVATKQLYASHYFHTALEVRAIVDDAERPGRGHYLLVLNMGRSDGLSGVFGGMVKWRARTASRDAVEAALRATKRLAEAS